MILKEFSSATDRSDCDAIILITIDSLRKDHLACYGYNGVDTRFIDALSTGGIRFENAFSHGGETPESFPSLMCSCPPPIRLQDRGVNGRKTLAKLLKETGFDTGGFHTNPWLSARNGYDQGFNTFYEGPWSKLPPKIQAVNASLNQLLLNRGPTTGGWAITQMSVDWLKRARKPVFLWLHYMDTHVPYLPEARRIGILNSMRNRVIMAMLLGRKVPNARTIPSPATKNALIHAYDSCISKLDSCISFIVSEVMKRFDRKLIILGSDHGEAHWEHGFFGHSAVYDEVLRIPLVMYGNNLVKGTI
ncbi:MAG: sulfatase, partial [Nitrososphaerales archaeon]